MSILTNCMRGPDGKHLARGCDRKAHASSISPRADHDLTELRSVQRFITPALFVDGCDFALVNIRNTLVHIAVESAVKYSFVEKVIRTR